MKAKWVPLENIVFTDFVSRQYEYIFSLSKPRQQECIPVGCVPSAAVAVTGGCLPRGCLPRGVSARRGVSDTPPVDRMTDTCKNITSPNYVADGNSPQFGIFNLVPGLSSVETIAEHLSVLVVPEVITDGVTSTSVGWRHFRSSNPRVGGVVRRNLVPTRITRSNWANKVNYLSNKHSV